VLSRSFYYSMPTTNSAVAMIDSMDRVVIVRVQRPADVAGTILDKINPLIDELAALKLPRSSTAASSRSTAHAVSTSRSSSPHKSRLRGTSTHKRTKHKAPKKNTRGDFVRVQCGYSHGRGSTVSAVMVLYPFPSN